VKEVGAEPKEVCGGPSVAIAAEDRRTRTSRGRKGGCPLMASSAACFWLPTSTIEKGSPLLEKPWANERRSTPSRWFARPVMLRKLWATMCTSGEASDRACDLGGSACAPAS